MDAVDNDANMNLYRILALDGGGAKGFYTLGVLKEIEGMVGGRLHETFDLVFGTSTGAIIASLIALGRSIDDIYDLYVEHLPRVMSACTPSGRTLALESLTRSVFGEASFNDVKTGIGVVATKWAVERPLIFKGTVQQAHGRRGTFEAGFGVPIADAIQASCAAYPFFLRKTIRTSQGDSIELMDGGYCANNPTLYAIADAIAALKIQRSAIRVISVGVGVYPEPQRGPIPWIIRRLKSVQLLHKTLECNTQSMDQLRAVLFADVPTVRISDTFDQPEMATDLLEYDLRKLNLLRQRGRESFASREAELRRYLL